MLKLIRTIVSRQRLVGLLLYTLLFSFILINCFSVSTFANDGNVNTTFFGDVKDEGNGCGVFLIINFIVEILTFGVGIAATIGVTISGITFLAASGDETKTTKAKRRIYEIIIGLAAYAALWAILSFLLPGGTLNNSPQCKQGTSSDSLFTTPNETSSNNSNNNSKGNSNNSKSNSISKKSNKTSTTTIDEKLSAAAKNATTEASLRLILTAEELANTFQKNRFTYSNSGQTKSYKKALTIKKGKANCATYVSLAAQGAGLLKNGKTFWISGTSINGCGESCVKQHFAIHHYSSSISTLAKSGKVKAGDVVGGYEGGSTPHTMLYVGVIKGKHTCYNGGRSRTSDGIYSKSKMLNYGCGSFVPRTLLRPKS